MEIPEFEFWYWWVAAAIFVVIEVFAPGIFFLWFGISAAIVGVASLLVPGLGWQYEILIFGVLSIMSAVGARMYLKQRPIDSDQPTLNRRGEQLIGRIVTLSDAIENGRGRVNVGDGTWSVEGNDHPVGTKVKVTGVDGIVLKVEKSE